MDWMTGREEYRESSASSSYSTHSSTLRDLDTEMEFPDLSPSFPSLLPLTLVANDGEYYSTAWRKTVQSNGNATSIMNSCNTIYPVTVSRESTDSYNWSVCQPDDAAYDNTIYMAFWKSQILDSIDSSPYRRRALDKSSQDGTTSTPWQSQSCNHETSSFITYKLKTPPHPITHNSSQKPETTNWPPQLQDSIVSDSSPCTSSYWTPPDHPFETIAPFINPTPFSSTLTTTLHLFHSHSHSLLYKSGVTPRELHMHLAAGSCGITIHGTVSIPSNAANDVNGKLSLILSQESPLNPRLYLPTQRKKISESMCQIVLELHGKGIVHGDIHLSNFLLCTSANSNDQIIVKLTNFRDSLFISDSSSQTLNGDDEEELWTPILNGRIVSPNRANQWFKGKATKEDDLYALAICMWEPWSGKKYDEMCGIWEDVRRGDLSGE
ncbi:hypothetical protein EAF04_009728 [Stromatinia cepivora]|nr:hypothetical protein EAF04_009728 [Stromatinia cepivora]